MTMKCQQCGREITADICPHCGGKAEPLKSQVVDTISLKDVARGSSEVTVEKEGETRTFKFGPQASSGEIATASLPVLDLIDPEVGLNIKGTVVQNIDLLDELARHPRTSKVTNEHSFELNFGVFKYRYKRIIEKD